MTLDGREKLSFASHNPGSSISSDIEGRVALQANCDVLQVMVTDPVIGGSEEFQSVFADFRFPICF